MERAETAAIRRASRTWIGTATLSRILAVADKIEEKDASFNAAVGALLKSSERTLIWVADQLDDLRLPGLPNEKRLQLAVACLHLAIEHGQAIVVLAQEECFGSALALQRPLIEAWTRGLWLRYVATESDVDRAGRDRFPGGSEIVNGLEVKFDKGAFRYLTGDSWSTFCSYTHTGYMQIGARLTGDGVRSNYTLEEIRRALHSADLVQVACGIEVAGAAGRLESVQAMLDFLKDDLSRKAAPPPPNDAP